MKLFNSFKLQALFHGPKAIPTRQTSQHTSSPKPTHRYSLQPQQLQPLKRSTYTSNISPSRQKIPTKIKLHNLRASPLNLAAGFFNLRTAGLLRKHARHTQCINKDNLQLFKLRKLFPDLIEANFLGDLAIELDGLL